MVARRLARVGRAGTVVWAPLAAALLLAWPAPGMAGMAKAAPGQQAAVVEFGGVQEGQTLAGTVAIQALVAGAEGAGVEFVLSGPAGATHAEGLAPYTFMGDVGDAPVGWDTRAYSNGEYTLTATAWSDAGRLGVGQVRFRVAN